MAFTLIELMVSMAVMALLLVLITQLFNTATAITTGGNKHMDADSEARLVFDRMALDFARIAKRSDIDYYFKKNSGGNDQMAFYSESTGYYPAGSTDQQKGSISLVGYRVRNNKLERLSKALLWNGSSSAGKSMVFLPQKLTDTWTNIAGSGSDPDYQIISNQVFRMEISFLIRDSSSAMPFQPYLSDTPYSTGAPVLATGPDFNGLRDVLAIVVTLAVLDSKSKAITTDAALSSAAGNLPDSNIPGSPGSAFPDTAAKLWKDTVESGSLGLPNPAASQIRVYQRYFYLNPI